MNNDEALFCRIHDLVVAVLDGSSTADQRHELRDLVCSSSDAALCYVHYMQESACLQWMFGDRVAADSLPDLGSHVEGAISSDTKKSLLYKGLVSLAASFLCLAATWWIVTSVVRQDHVAVDDSRQLTSGNLPVAILSHMENAKLEIDASKARPLQRLGVGQALSLASGFAEITFDCGAQVRLKGPARFEITSRDSARCDAGFVTADVSEQARGFTIQTPAAKVVDLGTRFGLGVDEQGSTKVVVFKGVVDLTAVAGNRNDDGERQVKRLIRGEALNVDNHGAFSRVMSIRSSDYPLSQPDMRARPQAPLIADVKDNIRDADSRNFYQIVPSGFDEDVLAYVDRPHQWNGTTDCGIPDGLRGADYVMPFNDDKFVENLEVAITLNEPAVLYVLLSEHLSPPDWLLQDFRQTALIVGLDEGQTRFNKKLSVERGPGVSIDTVFSVWERVVETPGTVVLGAVNRPPAVAGFNMYGLAAKRLRSTAPD